MKDVKYFKLGYMWLYLIPVWLFFIAILILSIIKLQFVLAAIAMLLLFVAMTLYLRWVLCFKSDYFIVFFLFEGIKRIKYKDLKKIYIDTKKLGAGQYSFQIIYKLGEKEKKAKFEYGGDKIYLFSVLNFIKDKTNSSIFDYKSFEKVNIHIDNS